MLRSVTTLALCVVAVMAPAAVAHDAGSWQHKNHFLRAQTFKLGGSPGCDLVADECRHTRRTGRSVREYFDTLRRMVAPRPVATPNSSNYLQPLGVTSRPVAAPGGGAGGDLAAIRACESGGDYSTNTGNGYFGAYQFDQQTWQAAGGTGMPHTASPAEQDRVAANWIAAGHRGAWPNC